MLCSNVACHRTADEALGTLLMLHSMRSAPGLRSSGGLLTVHMPSGIDPTDLRVLHEHVLVDSSRLHVMATVVG